MVLDTPQPQQNNSARVYMPVTTTCWNGTRVVLVQPVNSPAVGAGFILALVIIIISRGQRRPPGKLAGASHRVGTSLVPRDSFLSRFSLSPPPQGVDGMPTSQSEVMAGIKDKLPGRDRFLTFLDATTVAALATT